MNAFNIATWASSDFSRVEIVLSHSFRRSRTLETLIELFFGVWLLEGVGI